MTLRRLSGDVSGTSAQPPSISPSLEGINIKAMLDIPAPKEEWPAKRSRTGKTTEHFLRIRFVLTTFNTSVLDVPKGAFHTVSGIPLI